MGPGIIWVLANGVLALLSITLAVRRGWFKAPLVTAQVRASPVLAMALGAGLYCAIALAALIVQASILPPATTSAGNATNTDFATQARVLIGTYIIAAPLALVVWWWFARRPLSADGLLEQVRTPNTPVTHGFAIATALLASLVAAPVVVTAGTLAGQLAQLVGAPPPPTLAHTTLSGLADPAHPPVWRAGVILAVVVGVPVVEEVIYRGFLQTACTRALVTLGLTREHSPSAWPAIALTSVLFVAAHAGAVPREAWPAAGATLVALSLTLGLVYARTRSILAPVVIHALFNAANVLGALTLT
jgi:hypothetical protein